MSEGTLTALVLAGTRGGGDPLAEHAGVSHKALIPIEGRPMLERVVAAVAQVPQVGRILVAIERPEIVSALAPQRVPVTAVPAAAGPSASVAAVLAAEGTPLLLTTADHALLQPDWIRQMLQADARDADALVALARSEAVLEVAPGTQRTWLRFADGDYSGCNLFLLRTPATARIVNLWQEVEAARKRPLTLLRRLGLTYALRYRLGWLSLAGALGRLGRLTSATIQPVILGDGRAAIDVDKPADLVLVRELLSKVKHS